MKNGMSSSLLSTEHEKGNTGSSKIAIICKGLMEDLT